MSEFASVPNLISSWVPGRTASLPVSPRRTHCVLFDDPDASVRAVRDLRAEGFEVLDAFAPFPVHGMEEALGLRPTRLGVATLIGGIAGGCVAWGLQIWTHALDWPLNIGGKTDLAIPALVPVAFELTVLLAAFATVGALFWKGRLRPGLDGLTPETQPDGSVTDDHVAVLVAEVDGSFAMDRFRELVQVHSPAEIREGWRIE